MAAAAAEAEEPAAERDGEEEGEEKRPGEAERAATEPRREQLFDLIVETFLAKVEEAGSYQRFAGCYSRLYRTQPELIKCIYKQFISQLQTCFREEIQELKQEGNLEVLFGTLDKLVEGAKERETPAWRPSGIPEEDVRSAVVPYLLKQRTFLQKALKGKEEANAKLAEAVLAGRQRITDLQQEIQKRQAEWQAIAREGREIADSLEELQ
ncbi:polyamine-modulated factor 1 [Hemicordylus capensis]|uniref:polyamine-modulated factor 1 n=1 Tax=Hemicordylus capensis TaxID=884348 RepID=UPI002303EF55|nr:polyamine-modulated factor 1 [Hemicordylus capensis]